MISHIVRFYSIKYMYYIFLQYDLSASQFSPDGRVFQVEYAFKAVENSGYVSLHYAIIIIFLIESIF